MFMGAKRLPAGESGSSQLELPYPRYARARQRLSETLKDIIEHSACPADRVGVKASAALPTADASKLPTQGAFSVPKTEGRNPKEGR
jgi:hypothetical protein